MTDAKDRWDFYPCRVDDRPASISLNLRYAAVRPSVSVEMLYWLRIQMLDATEHGMGGPEEADALLPVEDAFVEQATKLGLVYVGSLRNNGSWQLTFYGPADVDEGLNALARESGLGGRRFQVGSKPDREWSYYREFLMPDAERIRWMADRRVIEVLEDRGDIHATPRRVDHWAYFPTAEARQSFVEAALREEFDLESIDDDERYCARVFRTDTVELEHIHAVVMILFKLAKQHGGDYDGWETSVET